jgi:protein tyrosine phosphatase (PTP) superfamily phosphohydrolase (DUF442 family)
MGLEDISIPAQPAPERSVSKTADALEGVVNVVQATPTVVTAGQPRPEHFRALKEAGVEIVLDVRHPMEPRGFDQEALLRELGLDYRVIPVMDGTLTDDTLEQVTDTLRQAEGKQVLFHCNTGNRVGGAILPYLILDQGMSEEDATTAAMRMGLRGAVLLEWGLDYARRHSANE